MPTEEPAGYHQLARLLRDQIHTGQLTPGERIPSETYLMQRHGLARETVRRAVAQLRNEGLIDVRKGYGAVVRAQPERCDLPLEPGWTVIARMPTPGERERLGIGDGVPVLHVQHGDGTGDVYPADRVRLIHPR